MEKQWLIKPPTPKKKRCTYERFYLCHKAKDHKTSKCKILNRAIEDMIHSSLLKDVVDKNNVVAHHPHGKKKHKQIRHNPNPLSRIGEPSMQL